MAFSTSFFALDPTESQPLSADSTADAMEGTNGTQERQASTDIVSRIKREDDSMEIDENVPPHILPSAEAATESSPAARSSPAGAAADEMSNGRPSPSANKTTPSSSKAPAKKKKGTATAVKAPKRARPSGGTKRGGARGGGGGAKKKSATSGPGSTAARSVDGENGENGAGPGDGSSESDSGPYCLCRGPDNHRFMIACDRCEDWFHGECIGMDKWTGENLVQKYICPNCSDGKRYVTRYKKTCSFEGCIRPARLYDPKDRSIFCSDEHCQAWWEQLIATLPKTKDIGFDNMTQEEFVGLLDTESTGDGWRLGKTPFAITENEPALPFNDEILSMLSRSAAERHALAEDIQLCKKMLQLIDMAVKRREAAIAGGKGTAKDLCGYDVRLDTVGVTRQFAAFLSSPPGEACFAAAGNRAGGLGLDHYPQDIPGYNSSDPLTSGMCTKKKCKPHAGWSAILTKDVKHSMREFARQAKLKLDREERIRLAAIGRAKRKEWERNQVVVHSSSGDDDA
ncbi:Set1 complex component spp1 [Echria macrotheca]|uniref:Set1 complex component spp1 n=1 Tax=Echria macrotheca TaxID=438768 RepID=A0AAJ0BK08_9PEZI|nr:Set1 complex component spp1 [Echria macrotheca]